mmetsp:Transcript_19776/g.54362  ORF Transcript_19776/g.54362 Transcript_19776/m.54362 type:complete len:257 (+) Transcript_19776:1275-2045(+)
MVDRGGAAKHGNRQQGAPRRERKGPKTAGQQHAAVVPPGLRRRARQKEEVRAAHADQREDAGIIWRRAVCDGQGEAAAHGEAHVTRPALNSEQQRHAHFNSGAHPWPSVGDERWQPCRCQSAWHVVGHVLQEDDRSAASLPVHEGRVQLPEPRPEVQEAFHITHHRRTLGNQFVSLRWCDRPPGWQALGCQEGDRWQEEGQVHQGHVVIHTPNDRHAVNVRADPLDIQCQDRGQSGRNQVQEDQWQPRHVQGLCEH